MSGPDLITLIGCTLVLALMLALVLVRTVNVRRNARVAQACVAPARAWGDVLERARYQPALWPGATGGRDFDPQQGPLRAWLRTDDEENCSIVWAQHEPPAGYHVMYDPIFKRTQGAATRYARREVHLRVHELVESPRWCVSA